MKSGVGTFGSVTQIPAPPGNDATRPSSCRIRSAVLAWAARAGARTPRTRQIARPMPMPRIQQRYRHSGRRVSGLNVLLTRCIVPEPEHFAVASRCLVLVPHQMQGAVRSQEGDLRLEGPPAPPGLPPGLGRADHDVAEAKHPVRIPVQVRPGSGAADPARQSLAERQHVSGPVDPPMPAVELAHLRVVDERERHLALARESKRPEGSTNSPANRGEVSGRLAGDGDAHRATYPLAAGLMRVMRSSGYGMRSWYTPRSSSQNASLILSTSRKVRSHSSSWPSATRSSMIRSTMPPIVSGFFSESDRTEASVPSATITIPASLLRGRGPG